MKLIYQGIFLIIACFFLAACANNGENNDQNSTDTSGQQMELPNQDNESSELDEENAEDSSEQTTSPDISEEEIAIENEAFKVFEPQPNAAYRDVIEVKGLAQVFEGTIQYEFEDGHVILEKGFTTASEGAPGWGEFSFTLQLDEAIAGEHTIILYEESAKDGSRLHELIIPVQVEK